MAARSPVKMMSELGFNGDDLGKDLGFWMRESDRERDLDIFRSGSAPPTVEGSLNAINGLGEEEMLSDPAYLSYYYKQGNLNPRLPPPVLSKEDWRSTQRLGGIGDRRNVGDGGAGSLFTRQPAIGSGTVGSEWAGGAGDGLIGLSVAVRKSFADVLQDDHGQSVSARGHPSRPSSRNKLVGTLGSAKAHVAFHQEMTSVDGLQPSRNTHLMPGLQSSVSPTFASVLGSSFSRNATIDPQMAPRAPSPLHGHAGGRLTTNDKKTNDGSHPFSGVSNTVESNDILTALSGMSLSSGGEAEADDITKSNQNLKSEAHQNIIFDSHSSHDFVKQRQHLNNIEKAAYHDPSKSSVRFTNVSASTLGNGPVDLHRPTATSNTYTKAPFTGLIHSPGGSPNSTGYGQSNLPPLFENAVAASAMAALGVDSRALGNGFPSERSLNGLNDLPNYSQHGHHSPTTALGIQSPFMDPQYLQYLRAAEYATQGAANYNDPSVARGYTDNSYLDSIGMQEAYLGMLLQHQKQYASQYIGKSVGPDNGYCGSPTFSPSVLYPGSPLASPIPLSPIGPGSPLMHMDRRLHSGLGSYAASWRPDPTGNLGEGFPSMLLEEFKNSKTRSFELSDIAGHVVEFSGDQYGSRFIQQKLETATNKEKTMVFEEIMPRALSLMTDVFGNYVIQKFFEHGTAAQIRELASQLNGHVLALSLQMYGCRVIQKAIEVVDLDQQTKMVAELDGHIMRCVRDQNGNHVIQKCIECIPQDAIQFIISCFYDQVVTLSTHPYGCRVIQRVLEHCDDPKTQQIVMDEIMQCVCKLAQDQYGNYVIQHVLEHGKPHERSAIIKKLAGQIVQMSQQKFASNVVEKCLTFGGALERQLLVDEILGSTDENEPLQAMMKDQFANYVVQKVLETCDDQRRELILSRIKVHLNALKKYTYGKHIVARVEKLVAAGERRIGLQSSYIA